MNVDEFVKVFFLHGTSDGEKELFSPRGSGLLVELEITNISKRGCEVF